MNYSWGKCFSGWWIDSRGKLLMSVPHRLSGWLTVMATSRVGLELKNSEWSMLVNLLGYFSICILSPLRVFLLNIKRWRRLSSSLYSCGFNGVIIFLARSCHLPSNCIFFFFIQGTRTSHCIPGEVFLTSYTKIIVLTATSTQSSSL